LIIERLLARFTDAIITVSPKQRQEILDYGIGRSEKVHVIGLGLDLQAFVNCAAVQGKLRQELQVEPDLPLVGIVARLVPVKGFSYFLKAAKLVSEIYPNCLFTIVGDGELRDALEQEAEELGIRDRLRFLGFRQDLAEIYADLDFVVLSSLNEGLPVALIEAMSAGKPVVATKVGGVGDLVQHERSGFLVRPKDSAALSEAMIRMLALPRAERVKMGQAGQVAVYPKYHISTLTANIEALYDTLLRTYKN
ncbi:MAG: glycosyltransferase family 4 protein, partial [bacterium]|nr:glycosyltransferase family 4 protein [bacterium]